VYLKRPDGRYVFVNRHFERLYRLPAAQVLGKTDAQLFPADQATLNAEADRSALAGETVESESAIEFGAEKRVYASIRFALRDSGRNVYALCGISTDITERKTAADALKYLASNLERRVARRTRELARLNDELEAFAYSVSHDLRAPLTAVNGFAELLLREHGNRLDHTGHRYLQRIRDGSLRMASLIQDLLGLSRVSQHSLKPSPIELSR
jgi:PAS domain S-box-containing protein